jgi:CBS domain-containing protein
MATLRDIMTQDLSTVDSGATLKEAATLMREQDIGNVLVMDGQTLRGILTDRDIVVRAVAYGHDLGSPVTDYATGDVLTLDAGTEIGEAARTMSDRQVRRVPVTDGGQVVGIVSLADLAIRASSEEGGAALEGISQPTV